MGFYLSNVDDAMRDAKKVRNSIYIDAERFYIAWISQSSTFIQSYAEKYGYSNAINHPCLMVKIPPF